MTTLVKINLRTLKENPNAGNTISVVNRGSTINASFNFHDINILEKIADCFIIDKYSKRNIMSEFHFSGRVIKKGPKVFYNKLIKLGVDPSTITVNIENHFHHVHHAPEPKYLYKRTDPKVTCKSCGKKSKVSKLISDESYYRSTDEYIYYENTCPACGTVECADIKYETIEQALERKG